MGAAVHLRGEGGIRLRGRRHGGLAVVTVEHDHCSS
jgi:hypothetical protein